MRENYLEIVPYCFDILIFQHFDKQYRKCVKYNEDRNLYVKHSLSVKIYQIADMANE